MANPLPLPQLSSSDVERFWGKVDVTDVSSCWLWTGGQSVGGYGRFRKKPRYLRSHRVSYTLMRGEIPEGLDIDHLCRNRLCVNPWHLEPVTTAENTRRGETFDVASWQRSKNECVNGHPFTPENTYIPPSKPGTRSCRACNDAREKQRRRRA